MSDALKLLMEVLKEQAVIGKKEIDLEIKEGRKLSKKTITIIKDAISALNALFENNSDSNAGEEKSLKIEGRKPDKVIKEEGKSEKMIMLRALQQLSGQINKTLRDVKK